MSRSTAAAVVLAVIALALPATLASGQEIAIGLVVPLSGPAAPVGIHARQGATIAVNEANEKGGVLGRKITLQVVDDRCDANAARIAVSNLLKSQVSFLIGPLCGAAIAQAAEVSAETEAIHIAGSRVSTDLVAKRGKGIFSRVYDADGRARALGEMLVKQGVQRIEVVVSTDAYGKTARESLSKVVSGDVFAWPLAAFEAQAKATWATRSAPEAVFFLTPEGVGKGAITTARAAGVKTIALTAEPSSIWVQALGTEANNLLVATSYPFNKGKVADFVGKFPTSKPYFYAQNAYDMISLLLAGIAKAGSSEPRNVRMSLQGLEMHGLAGPLMVDGRIIRGVFWPAKLRDGAVQALNGSHGDGKGSP